MRLSPGGISVCRHAVSHMHTYVQILRRLMLAMLALAARDRASSISVI